MTVSSGRMKQIRKRKEAVGAPKDLFRDMFYVKALDIPLNASRTFLFLQLRTSKEQQTTPTSVYNYQLHPFLWDKIRSLGQGITFFKGKKEKGMNGCAKVY